MSSKASTSRNLRLRSRPNPSTTTTSKKSEREFPAPSSPEPKRSCIGKKSHDDRNIDRYCWLCHKSDANSQENICITCTRVYHTSCLEKALSEFNDKKVCPECQMESVNGLEPSKSLDVQKLRKLLLAMTERKISEINLKKYKLFYSWPTNIGVSDLVKVMDLEIILDKINDSTPYTKTSEFFSDLKWICHNVIILFGHTSDKAGAAIKALKSFKTDLLDLEACPDCYARMLVPNDPNFFVNLCEPPHDIIWAKVKGYPYWPAKCLKVVNGVAHVRFFETHDLSDVPLYQCYHISKKHPNLPSKMPPKTAKYRKSLAELYEYVDLYEQKYGRDSFHFYDQITAYFPTTSPLRPVINNLNVPTAAQANIRLLPPLLIDLTEDERNDQPSTLAESSNGVNMTFSEERNRTLNDLESSANFPAMNLSEINDLRQVDASQSNETKVNINELLIPSITTNDANASASNIDARPPIFNQPPVDEKIGLSVGGNIDWWSHAQSICEEVWRTNNPTTIKMFSDNVKELSKYITNIIHLQNENDRLRVVNQSNSDKATKEVQGLKNQLQNLQEKYKNSRKELKDVIKNGRSIVDSIVHAANNFWTPRVNECKQELEACKKKLDEKDNLIAEIEEQRDSMRSSLHELKNRYQEASIELLKFKNCEKLSAETQTDLKSADVLSKEDFDTLLELNTIDAEHSIEKEMFMAILEAKRLIYCNKCLQPANIHCCMMANYCSQACQEKDAAVHSQCCQRI